MFAPIEDDPAPLVSTGRLPTRKDVVRHVHAAYQRYRDNEDGRVADYIPALAQVPRHLFGIAAVGSDGTIVEVGDVGHPFSIQSVSKPFVYALAMQAVGAETVQAKIGVNATGLPFNSVMAIELNPDRTMNSMVNAGAIATTSLTPGDTAEAK